MEKSGLLEIKKELSGKYEECKRKILEGTSVAEIASEIVGNISEPGNNLRTDIVLASRFALEKFGDKKRRDGTTPLVLHSLFLPFILNFFGEKRPEALLTALLHDTIEDTATTFEELESLRCISTKANILQLVKFLTQDKNISDELPKENVISARVQSFMEGLVGAPAPVIDVEIADRIHDFLDLAYMRSLEPESAAVRFANKKERNKTIVSLITKGRDDLNNKLLEFFWFLYENAGY